MKNPINILIIASILMLLIGYLFSTSFGSFVVALSDNYYVLSYKLILYTVAILILLVGVFFKIKKVI